MGRRRRGILRAGALTLVGALAGCGRRGGSADGTATTDRTTPAGARDPSDGTATAGTASRSTTAGSPEESAAGTTTAAPAEIGTSRPVGDGRVTVNDVAVRDSVILEGPQPFAVDAARGGRWVFFDVASEDVAVDPNALRLVTDDAEYRGTVELGGLSVRGFDHGYGRAMGPGEDDEGWIAVRVPAQLATDRVRVVFDGAAWRLPARLVDRLRLPKPTFEVTDFRVPAAVAPGEAIDAEFAVRNSGDRPGTFRAVCYATVEGPTGLGHRGYAVEVGPGERATLEQRFDGWETFYEAEGGETGSIDVHLDIPGGVREASVRVNETTTADG